VKGRRGGDERERKEKRKKEREGEREREREREREAEKGDGRFIGTVVALFVRGALIEKIRTFLFVKRPKIERYSQFSIIRSSDLIFYLFLSLLNCQLNTG